MHGIEDCNQRLRSISIVGIGGLGKTTLARAVYDNIKAQFRSKAFVSVGQEPDIRNIFKKILHELDEQKYANINEAKRDEEQLINELRRFLKDTRYLIVVDDVWETKTWKFINCAFVDSNCGSRVITTTRKNTVAEVVVKEVGDIYTMEPLSSANSERLFYGRIFGDVCKAPTDYQLIEATEKILKKCGGVPLSIITIASLLADKSIRDWSSVYDSIGFGPTDKNEVVENTRKILSFSYYDLPSYLKPCLLYLSIYPEDHWIQNNSLIWKWVAEGFVHKEPGKALFEVGESYLIELIRKSMIQPAESYGSFLTWYRIHDMVLDLIRILATKENFVKILDREAEEHSLSSHSSTVRRIALHKRGNQEENDNLSAGMKQLRSLNAIQSPISTMPSLVSFQVLRVLALEDCDIKGGLQLKHIGKLRQLRYLGLRGTKVSELPSDIVELVDLQTLDVLETGLKEVPRSIGKLSKLMYLRVSQSTRILTGFGNLRSLQVLSIYWDSIDNYENFAVEVGKLTELRSLTVDGNAHEVDDNTYKCLMESLCSLHKIQNLAIFGSGRDLSDWEGWDHWEPHRKLSEFFMSYTEFPRLPAWVNSTCVPYLSELTIDVSTVEAKDLDALARLPLLSLLRLNVRHRFPWAVAGGGGLFQNLRFLNTNMPLAFLRGATPKLKDVELYPHVSQDGDASDIGLGSLPLLKTVEVALDCEAATPAQVEEAEAAWRHTVHAHPNRPVLYLRREGENLMKEDSDPDEEEISDTDEVDGNDDDEISAQEQQIYTKKMKRETT
ncbi:disease resistance protein RGA5-like isoform X1 [Oryza brachyantha]|uniref:disease resistance protein RGA5-like isoform X1 n=1 Tax=Oryza brachyantha TaxID=4533 RepID=UPI001ADA57E1|nr:disease resistance protein RGA5-like isoform X1 [Oryza brachyantha]